MFMGDNVAFFEDRIEVRLNPRVYSLDAVFSAAYVLMERAYIIVDEDESKRLVVTLRPKSGQESRAIASDFNDELISYSVYLRQCKKSGRLREEMLKRALLTNLAQENEQEIEDPEEILVPWEEKYS